MTTTLHRCLQVLLQVNKNKEDYQDLRKIFYKQSEEDKQIKNGLKLAGRIEDLVNK